MQLKYGFSIDSIQNSCNKFAVQIVKNKNSAYENETIVHHHAAFVRKRNGCSYGLQSLLLQDTPPLATIDNQAKASFAYLPSPKTPVSPSTSVMQLQRPHPL